MNKEQFLSADQFTARKTGMGCGRIPAISPAFLVLLGASLFGGGKISPLLAQDSALRPVSGVVLAEDTGKPVANALVRVASPATEMRSTRGPRQGLYDARTDANGRFTIQVPQNAKISLNAFARSYEEAAGMWMSANGAFQDVPFPSTPKQELKLKLRPALYVAGVVADESGHPFSGAAVEAALSGENFTGYVAFDTSDANGRFEIFDFPLKPEVHLPEYWKSKVRGQLTFQNPAKLNSIIKDVYTMSETERTNLHVTVGSGHAIKGVITSTAGQPAAYAIVEAVPADKTAAQRISQTDDEGRFLVRGLPDGEVSVRTHSSAFDQEAQKTVQLAGVDAGVNLRLEPVVLKDQPKPVNLFGMKLADMTPELQAVYDLDSPTGVLILDPGANHLRLGIGALSQGDRFWIVGGKEIKNLPEMVAELLRIDAIAPPGDPNEGCHGSIRVVYAYRNRAGTNTQRLKLTAEDIAELKSQLRDRIP